MIILIILTSKLLEHRNSVSSQNGFVIQLPLAPQKLSTFFPKLMVTVLPHQTAARPLLYQGSGVRCQHQTRKAQAYSNQTGREEQVH